MPENDEWEVVGSNPITTVNDSEWEVVGENTAKPSPIAEQEAFKQQFIQQRQPQSALDQALSDLVAPFNAALGGVKSLGKTALEGVGGVGSILARSLNQRGASNKVKTLLGDLTQTSAEIGPRLAYELSNAARQAIQNPEETSRTLLRNIPNPVAQFFANALTPNAPPTQSEAQAAFENELVNRGYQQQGEQSIYEQFQRQLGLEPIGKTNIEVARAAPLLAGAEVIPGLVKSAVKTIAPNIVARTLPATAEQSAMAALDLTKEEVARHIPIVNQRIAEISKSLPKTANEALKVVNTAEKSLYENAIAVDKLATEQGLAPRSDLVIRNVEETLNNIPNLLPKERIALLEDAKARYSDVSTTAKGRALHQRLNKEFEAQFANDTFDRAAPANEVKLAVRNSIAEQMDEIGKAVTGKDASPYSDIGSLIEFKSNLGKTLQRIEGAEARAKTGIGSAKATNLPITKTQAAYQAKKTILTPFKKTQLEKLDQNVSKIFKEGQKAGEAQALSTEAQQALIQKYSPQAAPPLSPGVTSSLVPDAALESLIQNQLQSLPAALRNRSLAEAIVRQGQ